MEITAPGGDLEKIRYAALFGADAIYCGYQKYGLRAAAGNLSRDEILTALDFVHAYQVKLYLTLNAYLGDQELAELAEFVRWLDTTSLDAVIVSDPGVFEVVQKHSSIPIHISTQANITNVGAARFWAERGAKRIIPARELSFADLCRMRDALPDTEIECFIHGAMCIAYSGRCLLSAYLNKRSANQGACTHPCRWVWALTEESRPGEYFPVEEDQYGTSILSSKDLCLLNRIPELEKAGITAGKIEGRMKSLYYVSQLSRIYKTAVQTAMHDQEMWNRLSDEVEKVSHRPYWEGFYEFTGAGVVEEAQSGDYSRDWQYCGKVFAHQDGMLVFDALAKISLGDTLEVIYPDLAEDASFVLDRIYDDEDKPVEHTRPNFRYRIPVQNNNGKAGILRKCVTTS